MSKILEIESCVSCPHLMKGDTRWFCFRYLNKEITTREIPIWCPLPDKKEK